VGNTLAYYDSPKITPVKSFKAVAAGLWADLVKLFTLTDAQTREAKNC
jgi:hypothetical protein